MGNFTKTFIALVWSFAVVASVLLYLNTPTQANAIIPDCEFLFQYEEWTVVRCRERQ